MSDPRETCLLSLCSFASSMHDAAMVHHWTKGFESSDYHIRQAHKEFAKMAEFLGYKVIKKPEAQS